MIDNKPRKEFTQELVWAREEALREAEEHAQEKKWQMKGLPDTLIKANGDPFFYALGLKNGQVFHFSEAHLGTPDEFNGWFRITEIQSHSVTPLGLAFTFERGVDINLSEVAWVADAPFGS